MIIITGGAGFIGSCLLADLNAHGQSDILVVDNLGTGDKWKNLVGKRFLEVLSKEDFREIIFQGENFGGVETIFHLGACSSTTERNADYLLDNNYRYSKDLCLWAREIGARFIYASSGATYGDGSNGYDDSDEASMSNRPLNMYGYSKQLFDEWILSKQLQNETVGIKFFNVYGPNEYHKGAQASVVFKQYSSAAAGEPIRLFKSYLPGYADGEQRRDFIYVKDCTKVLRFFQENKNANGIFNLGTGTSRTWNDLAKAMFAACNREPQIEFIDMPTELQGKYQYLTEANMEKLRAVGYSEKFFSIEEGIHDYVHNYLSREHNW